MSLQKKVTVNTFYTRSVNLERDADSIEIIHSYIPTSRALRTFLRIADTFKKNQAPRAWSLVGPYGSGKSSFSVFLSHLLSRPSAQTTKASHVVLAKSDKLLANSFKASVRKNDGYLKVLVTGSPEPMAKRLLQGFFFAAENFWSQRSGKNPNIISLLKTAARKDSVTVSEILDLIQKLQLALEKANCGGILLIIDELGKFLEFEARHYGANDIYLLQALAEHACKGNKVNLLLFALLHQSFEQYAKGLGENLKNEWSKVQGRFEEIPFLESAEQVLRVVSAAFTHNFNSKEKSIISKNIKVASDVIHECEIISNVMTKKEMFTLFNDCYPLHPVSAILLPMLCQKIAQNERTLFSYLGSHEDYGLQDMLERLEDASEFIYPHHIYDYFIANQSAAIGDYITHRRWAEVVTAIERLGDANQDEINLLKTIGILNIVGSKGNFKAAEIILGTCTKNKSSFKKSIKQLSEKSVINYRRFNSEYRVWQGSDFDLEDALQEEINNLGNYSLAKELAERKDILPIVARKYTIESGTLRYFQPTFVDAKTYLDTEKESEVPRIIYYLAFAKDDDVIFRKKVINYFSTQDIIVLCRNGSQLMEAITEVLALKRVQINRQELKTDNIAKREFEDCLTAAEHVEDVLLDDLLNTPEDSEWFNNAKSIKIANKRCLQGALSSVLKNTYGLSPIIRNEMINRAEPSAQAAGARKELLFAMLENPNKEDLSIEGYPPQKAIYRSLLFATRLHRKYEGQWKFKAPQKNSNKDEFNIRHVWKRIEEFIDTTKNEPKSFTELSNVLMAAPYGVKAGTLPILYFAAYLHHENELAVYENRIFRPVFTKDMIETFLKRPNDYTFECFHIEGFDAEVIEGYKKILSIGENAENILDIAKPLAKVIGNLPSYTQKTSRGLSDIAYKARNAFNLAKSPQSLIFKGLPEALGYKDFSKRKNEKQLEKFLESLLKVLNELANAYDALLKKEKELLAHAFNKPANIKLSELRNALSGRCHGLENYTIDTKGVGAFIRRINTADGTDEAWFEELLSFLGHKLPKSWTDSDQAVAEFRLIDFSRHIIDLEKISLYERDKGLKLDTGLDDVYLLTSIKSGQYRKEDVISVNKESKDAVKHVREEIEERLKKLSDKKLMLAVIAEIVDDFLDNKESTTDREEILENVKDAQSGE